MNAFRPIFLTIAYCNLIGSFLRVIVSIASANDWDSTKNVNTSASTQFNFGVATAARTRKFLKLRILVSCATGLPCPTAFSDWAKQGQCSEVFGFDSHRSCQRLDSLDNGDRSK